MKKVIVITPHPDDETLGCGGSLLKHKAEGDEIYWLIVTGISVETGFTLSKVNRRNEEIKKVSEMYDFNAIHNLSLPTTRMDTLPMADIVARISDVFQMVMPEVVYLPYRGDIHSDHKIIFDAVVSCTKWFRYEYITRILVYETLSETDFNINPDNNGFHPNVFINIEKYLSKKVEIMKIYDSEMGDFPFPRSEAAIRALATIRGAASGYQSAEAFMLLKERLQ
jgi:LmbE family N-acetylglucosaminyl deacetylase